jgi:hypothetical protein
MVAFLRSLALWSRNFFILVLGVTCSVRVPEVRGQIQRPKVAVRGELQLANAADEVASFGEQSFCLWVLFHDDLELLLRYHVLPLGVVHFSRSFNFNLIKPIEL